MKIKSVLLHEDYVEVAVMDASGNVTTFNYAGAVKTNLQSDNSGGLWLAISTVPPSSEGSSPFLKNERF